MSKEGFQRGESLKRGESETALKSTSPETEEWEGAGRRMELGLAAQAIAGEGRTVEFAMSPFLVGMHAPMDACFTKSLAATN